MKAVILAGGRGTRISEESHLRPKPMVTIGDQPILWHIMKIYAAHGITDFIVCLGYRGYVIKEYFANYVLHSAESVTFQLNDAGMKIHSQAAEPWNVTLVETGMETQTGGRLKRVADWLKNEECFCLTYGDGLADIDVSASIAFHKKHGGLATVTAVAPSARFGVLKIDGTRVSEFTEKPAGEGALINGGFFVLSPKVIEYIDDDSTIWERRPMEKLSSDGELFAFRHSGFWQPMDTIREREILETMWSSGRAHWKVW